MLGLTTVCISGRSMEPSMGNGDWWLVRRGSTCTVGRVVLLRHPSRPDLLMVKRIRRIDDGGVWVEGDNPAGSQDSRQFGPVPPECIVGRLILRYRRGPRERGQ